MIEVDGIFDEFELVEDLDHQEIDFRVVEYCTATCEYSSHCIEKPDKCCKMILKDVLNNLPPRQEKIVKSVYGICGYSKTSKADLAKEYMLSKYRIDQILNTAIYHLGYPERFGTLIEIYDFFLTNTQSSYCKLIDDVASKRPKLFLQLQVKKLMFESTKLGQQHKKRNCANNSEADIHLQKSVSIIYGFICKRPNLLDGQDCSDSWNTVLKECEVAKVWIKFLACSDQITIEQKNDLLRICESICDLIKEALNSINKR